MVLGRRRVGEAVTSWGESRRGPKRPTHPVGHLPGSFSQALGPISWSIGHCSLRGVSLPASGGPGFPRQPGRTQATGEPLSPSSKLVPEPCLCSECLIAPACYLEIKKGNGLFEKLGENRCGTFLGRQVMI